MSFLAAVLSVFLSAAPVEKPAIVVNAADTPVRLDRATVLIPAEGPPVLLYAATNTTSEEMESLTVTAFIFDAEGTLKARQTAPGRRTLEVNSTKYSTLVLDGSPVTSATIIVVGVTQAQRVNSETWWRTDLGAAAQSAAIAARTKK